MRPETAKAWAKFLAKEAKQYRDSIYAEPNSFSPFKDADMLAKDLKAIARETGESPASY